MKHAHRCPCGQEFDCHCPSETSHGEEALMNGWRYGCLDCDPEPCASDWPNCEPPDISLDF